MHFVLELFRTLYNIGHIQENIFFFNISQFTVYTAYYAIYKYAMHTMRTLYSVHVPFREITIINFCPSVKSS